MHMHLDLSKRTLAMILLTKYDELTSSVSGSNQWLISLPALLIIGFRRTSPVYQTATIIDLTTLLAS